MSKSTIKDCRVKIIPTMKLIKFLTVHIDSITEIPENVMKVLTKSGCKVSSKIEIIKESAIEHTYKNKINYELLRELCPNEDVVERELKSVLKDGKETNDEIIVAKEQNCKTENYLFLPDIEWLNEILGKLRKEKGSTVYLHEMLEQCAIVLPENEIIERNPILEARCQRLREEQQNRVYQKMTKNVDAVLKNYPEDTFAYQIKSINRQIVAVLQFVFSVVAGFVFGFLGVQLIVGNLDFGFRLLLGIICALVIALAEIYFLAKKLNEIDDATSSTKISRNSPNHKNKVHTD